MKTPETDVSLDEAVTAVSDEATEAEAVSASVHAQVKAVVINADEKRKKIARAKAETRRGGYVPPVEDQD